MILTLLHTLVHWQPIFQKIRYGLLLNVYQEAHAMMNRR